MSSFLHENNVYETFHRTESAFLKVTNNILIFCRFLLFCLNYVESCAAFDTVDLELRMEYFEHCGEVKGLTLNWFKPYIKQLTLENTLLH